MAAWTYILRCADGTYYVGCTTNLEQRLGQHHDGTFGGYTSLRRPVTMVWAQEFDEVTQAAQLERRLKGWSRAKKQAVIRGDWDTLPALARRGSASFETAAARPPQDDDRGSDHD